MFFYQVFQFTDKSFYIIFPYLATIVDLMYLIMQTINAFLKATTSQTHRGLTT